MTANYLKNGAAQYAQRDIANQLFRTLQYPSLYFDVHAGLNFFMHAMKTDAVYN